MPNIICVNLQWHCFKSWSFLLLLIMQLKLWEQVFGSKTASFWLLPAIIPMLPIILGKFLWETKSYLFSFNSDQAAFATVSLYNNTIYHPLLISSIFNECSQVGLEALPMQNYLLSVTLGVGWVTESQFVPSLTRYYRWLILRDFDLPYVWNKPHSVFLWDRGCPWTRE